ncbi:hypothetical protein Hanom_Chr09g00784251 [Helianthus anomalus]
MTLFAMPSNTQCDWLFQPAYLPLYQVMMCEFLASFDFAPRPVDQPKEDEDLEHPWDEVSFRLSGVA